MRSLRVRTEYLKDARILTIPAVDRRLHYQSADSKGAAMRRAVLCGILMAGSLSLGAGAPLKIKVSPAVSFAPAFVRIQATIDAHADNRAVEITADSGEFYRSSRVQLEGDKAARTNVFEFPGLPSGEYEITATLFGSDGKPRGQVHQSVNVVSRGH
jgi:hypothetical protein